MVLPVSERVQSNIEKFSKSILIKEPFDGKFSSKGPLRKYGDLAYGGEVDEVPIPLFRKEDHMGREKCITRAGQSTSVSSRKGRPLDWLTTSGLTVPIIVVR